MHITESVFISVRPEWRLRFRNKRQMAIKYMDRLIIVYTKTNLPGHSSWIDSLKTVVILSMLKTAIQRVKKQWVFCL